MSHVLRSDRIKALIRVRANGVCEACHCPAPFIDANGDPYLVEHHITPISEGGDDSELNTAYICPNCHNRVHNGIDAREFNDRLRVAIQTKQTPINRERHFRHTIHCRQSHEDDLNQHLEEGRAKREQRLRDLKTTRNLGHFTPF